MLSIHCKTSLYTSLSKSLSNSDSSSSSKYSNTYYLSLNEHWKTSEHAQLVTKQAKEHTRRQLKLLEKSFKLEKQKITEEVLIAHGDATTVEFNNYLDEAPPVNPEKSHAVSQPKTRSGIDSAVRFVTRLLQTIKIAELIPCYHTALAHQSAVHLFQKHLTINHF